MTRSRPAVFRGRHFDTGAGRAASPTRTARRVNPPPQRMILAPRGASVPIRRQGVPPTCHPSFNILHRAYPPKAATVSRTRDPRNRYRQAPTEMILENFREPHRRKDQAPVAVTSEMTFFMTVPRTRPGSEFHETWSPRLNAFGMIAAATGWKVRAKQWSREKRCQRCLRRHEECRFPA